MRILFYADTVFGFGGVQRVLAVIAKSLSVRHDVSILSTDLNPDMSMYGYGDSNIHFDYIHYESPHDMQYCLCKAASLLYKTLLPKNDATASVYARSFFLPRYKKMLVRKINNGHYDVVIGVHAFLSLHLASVRAQLNVARVIGWMHNCYDALFEKQSPYLPGLKSFFSSAMRHLDDIVVLSQSDSKDFASRLGLKSIVIYNPLTLQPRGHASRSHCRFLSVGRFSPRHKGFDLLIRAFALFAKTNDEWTLEIVGEGEEEPLYREMISEYGLHDRILVTPFTKDIQSHYAGSSVYVLSSRWEGQPLVLVEAMSHGLPVISSDIPISTEILSGKSFCRLFECGNVTALAAAMSEMSGIDDWQRLSDESMAYSRHFDISHILNQWDNIIKF